VEKDQIPEHMTTEQMYFNGSDEGDDMDDEEEQNILGSDNDEQEDPKDYCKGL